MPRAGCDAQPTQTTGWCPKTRPAPIITQQARVIDGSMLVQLLRRWYNIDPSIGECLLLVGKSATGTVKTFTIILPYFPIYICDDKR